MTGHAIRVAMPLIELVAIVGIALLIAAGLGWLLRR